MEMIEDIIGLSVKEARIFLDGFGLKIRIVDDGKIKDMPKPNYINVIVRNGEVVKVENQIQK